MVAGLNAHLRLVRRGCLRKTFRSVLRWLESHANPVLKSYGHGLRIDLAWFQATACGYCQFGLLVYAIDVDIELSTECQDGRMRVDQLSRYFYLLIFLLYISFSSVYPFECNFASFYSVCRGNSSSHHWEDALLDRVNNRSEYLMRQKRSYGAILDTDNIRCLEEKRDLFFPLTLILHNTKPVGHQVQILLIVWIELC